jgi:hypothetical protein
MPTSPGAKPYHFIGGGGAAPVAPADVNGLLTWHIANPEAEVFVWLDQKNGPDAAKSIRASLGGNNSFTLKDVSEQGGSADATAAALRLAAQAGAPFCEECEKAKLSPGWKTVETSR